MNVKFNLFSIIISIILVGCGQGNSEPGGTISEGPEPNTSTPPFVIDAHVLITP